MTGGYVLARDDSLVVIDANTLLETDDPTGTGRPAYALLLEISDGRWLVQNTVTSSPTEAARMMHLIRNYGWIDLSDWTDVTALRKNADLDWTHALVIGTRRVDPSRIRRRHPDAADLSELQAGDSAHVLKYTSPDRKRVWWVIMLMLSDGTMLQHVLPFDTSAEADTLLREMARSNAFVTDDFLDVTEEMRDVEIDRSDEVEIDQNGNRRLLQ